MFSINLLSIVLFAIFALSLFAFSTDRIVSIDLLGPSYFLYIFSHLNALLMYWGVLRVWHSIKHYQLALAQTES